MISFIVPTIGRSSLVDTLKSIETWPGDEILVVGKVFPTGDLRPRYFPCANGNDWGGKERNIALTNAGTRYLAFLDDDDVYMPGARHYMQHAIHETPGKPVLFRMQYPNGITLWQNQELRCGNVGTPMILIPNMPTRLGTWTSHRVGDFQFLESMRWPVTDIVWRPEIIARLGHNEG
jgi:hypothetical protein